MIECLLSHLLMILVIFIPAVFHQFYKNYTTDYSLCYEDDIGI
jgi:hypothetical protein